MKDPANHSALGEAILELIRHGITLSDAVTHFIDSTFSAPSLEDFRRIIDDPQNADAETVFELIFFPDLEMQTALEPVLQKTAFTPEDMDAATGWLIAQNPAIPVTFPDGRGSLPVHLTQSSARQLVGRFNITKEIDPRLAALLEHVVGDPIDKNRLRVRLRNVRARLSGAACSFLCDAIQKMYGKSSFFDDAFTFLLEFFEYADVGQDFYAGLMREKNTILQSIARAEKNEKALFASNAEVLMLKGVHLLSVNIPEARKKITLIDHICINLFGKTEILGPAPQEERIFSADTLE